jgi:DNA-binding NarL/FixJ family response regulator
MLVNAVVLDDHALFSEGLKALLSHLQSPDIRVIGTFKEPTQALDLIKSDNVDVLFLDLNLGREDGLDWIAPFRKADPDIKIIILTMYDDGRFIKRAFLSGADGYLLKGVGSGELREAVEAVIQGKTFMGSGVQIATPHHNSDDGVEKNNGNTRYSDAFILKHNLTRREIEVLTLITQAYSNKEIARKLYISDQTVSVHRKNLMRKLGVSNTVSLIKIANELSIE